MLALTLQAAEARTADEAERLARRTAATEAQIDASVWRLFRISDAEKTHILEQLAYFATPEDAAENEDFALTASGAAEQVRQVAGRG